MIQDFDAFQAATVVEKTSKSTSSKMQPDFYPISEYWQFVRESCTITQTSPKTSKTVAADLLHRRHWSPVEHEIDAQMLNISPFLRDDLAG